MNTTSTTNHHQIQHNSQTFNLPAVFSDLNDSVLSLQDNASSTCYLAFQESNDADNIQQEFAKAYAESAEISPSSAALSSNVKSCNSPKEPISTKLESPTKKNKLSGIFNFYKRQRKNNNQADKSVDLIGKEITTQHMPTQHKDDVSDDSESSDDEDEEALKEAQRLDKLGRLLSLSWHQKYGRASKSPEFYSRLVNFKYAQERRKEVYGTGKSGWSTPIGIFGLYEHLADIRTDIRWADEVECRRTSGDIHIAWEEFDDEQDESWHKPKITLPLMIMCTLVLVLSIYLNGWRFEPLSVNPVLGPSSAVLIKMGAKSSDLIVNNLEIHRLFTPMFLHGGVIHYGINMVALHAVGTALEQAHGAGVTAILFVISGVGATIISAVFAPQYISVGASGAIFGLVGACIGDIILHWSLLFGATLNGPVGICRLLFILFTFFFEIAINFVIGLTPAIDNWTHMGGLFYGFLLSFVLMNKSQFSPKTGGESQTKWMPIVCTGAVTITMVWALVVLFTGDGKTSPCESCQSMSCVEFPPWKDSTQKWWYCDNCEYTVADVRSDEESGKYDLMMLYCPDGSIVHVNVDYYVTDEGSQSLSDSLPTFCRAYCAKS